MQPELTISKDETGRVYWAHLNRSVMRRGSFATDLKTVCRGLGRILKRNESPLPAEWIAESEVVPSSQETHLTWVGHATFLIQSAGLNFVIDPFWGDYKVGCFALFRRLHPALPPLDKMPHIDAILLSHRHTDHCDENALRFFVSRNPECKAWVPQGNREFMMKLGFKDENIMECEWGDMITIRKMNGKIDCTFLPAAHDADGNSLWGSWQMRTPDGITLLHAGDTGACPYLEQLPKSNILLMPIAPYTFRDLQQPAHLNAQEAVELFQKIGNEKSVFVPMHWGTLPYCQDDPEENREQLQSAFHGAGLRENQLKILKLGERVSLLGVASLSP